MPKPNSDCRATERKHPWPMVRLGDVCEILDSKRVPITKKDRVCGDIPYYGATGVVDYVSDFIFDERLVLLGEDGAKWGAGDNSAFIIEGKSWVNNHAHVLRPMSLLDDSFLVWYLNYADLGEYITGVTVPKLNQQRMGQIEIPLPPLSIQREIVARLERELAAVEKMKKGFETLAETAKAEFKAELKEVFEEISRRGAETRRLGEVCETISTRGHQIKQSEIHDGGKYPVVSQSENDIEGWTEEDIAIYEVPLVLFGDHTCVVKKIERPFVVGADGTKLLVVKECDNSYLFYFVKNVAASLLDGEYRRHYSDLAESEFPVPPLSAQREVVARLDSAKARAENLELKAREGVAVCETMRKAILKEAFE